MRRQTPDDGFHKGNVRCIKQTDKALLCKPLDQLPGDDEPFWVPQSQIHDDSEVYGQGDEGELVVTTWYATKEGWV